MPPLSSSNQPGLKTYMICDLSIESSCSPITYLPMVVSFPQLFPLIIIDTGFKSSTCFSLELSDRDMPGFTLPDRYEFNIFYFFICNFFTVHLHPPYVLGVACLLVSFVVPVDTPLIMSLYFCFTCQFQR